MIAGFQCVNDAGSFQIDGVYPQFVLKRKLDVATTYWVNGETTGYSMAAVAVGSDEVIAISSSTPCAVTYRQGSNMILVSQGYTGTVITVFVFGSITSASGAGMGLQVFNGNGSIIFDSSLKPLIMIGFPTGEGSFTYNGSRTYAAICVNQYYTVQDIRGGGQYETQHLQMTQGMVKAIPGGINISNIKMYDTLNVFDPNQTDLDRSVPAGTPNRHIIVDTTYF
ncbi:hypothetical protein [Pseudoduganella sp. R-43]|uniref:hypothetical protein n=1 Tax=Pseudoduganella sp. R-43 TaxID=3404063 RepID=UPI003CE70A07